MKAHPKIKKTVKWAGALLSALLIGVQILSIWFRIEWIARSGEGIGTEAGVIGFGSIASNWPKVRHTGWNVEPHDEAFKWGFAGLDKGPPFEIEVPL